MRIIPCFFGTKTIVYAHYVCEGSITLIRNILSTSDFSVDVPRDRPRKVRSGWVLPPADSGRFGAWMSLWLPDYCPTCQWSCSTCAILAAISVRWSFRCKCYASSFPPASSSPPFQPRAIWKSIYFFGLQLSADMAWLAGLSLPP